MRSQLTNLDRNRLLWPRFPSYSTSLLKVLLLATAAGCGGSNTSVKGTVTYDGKPVTSGVISINPADGQGKQEGSKVIDGAYQISPIAAGSKKVVLMGSIATSPEATPENVSSESKLEAYGPKKGAEAIDIPPDAIGQGQTIEIKEGEQTIDLKFSSPANQGKRRR